MADERDLELLDEYLSNKLGETDRSAFEQKLQADPDLQHEYALQRRLIKGIKDARVAELKSMLSRVSVPANNPGSTLASKIVLGTVVSIMIAGATYWYITRDPRRMADRIAPSEEQITDDKPIAADTETDSDTDKIQEIIPEKQTIESDKNQTSAGTEQSKPSLSKKPDPLQAPGDKTGEQSQVKEPVLDVFDPGAEENKSENKIKENQPLNKPGKSSLIVETDRENRRYTFHFQFRDGKLFLYGPFEKNLYEIMEFFTDEKRTVFLYYKDRYYLLEERDSKIKPLTTITDPALLKKLREYRSSK